MADFKDQVATFEGGHAMRLANDLFYEPEIDMIVSYLTYMDARHGNIDGSHIREAKRMVRFNYPETYEDNKGISFTSDKMYIGLSPEVCRYMSMKLNEAGHTVVGETSMHKLLAEMRVGEAEMRHRHGKMWPCDSHQRHPKAPDGLTWLRVSA
eukprot:jgi/Tetstr1/437842/TSEL_026482.t1